MARVLDGDEDANGPRLSGVVRVSRDQWQLFDAIVSSSRPSHCLKLEAGLKLASECVGRSVMVDGL